MSKEIEKKTPKKKAVPAVALGNSDGTRVKSCETKTDQLQLFEILELRDGNISNAIDLYDSLPKYSWDKRYIESTKEAYRRHICRVRGMNISVEITAAVLASPNGESRLVFPTEREEILEDVLRKLAVNGKSIIIADDKTPESVGVQFTLYDVFMELKKIGHTLSYPEIKESLWVLNSSMLRVEFFEGGRKKTYSTAFFPRMSLSTRANKTENPDEDSDDFCMVQFHDLVSRSINEMTFRPYNYAIAMSISSPIVRLLYKHISQYCTGVGDGSPYTRSMKAFFESTPRGFKGRVNDSRRVFESALKQLIKMNVLKEDYGVDVRRVGRKIEDIIYTMYPTDMFIKEMKAHNHRVKRNKAKLKSKNEAKGLGNTEIDFE